MHWQRARSVVCVLATAGGIALQTARGQTPTGDPAVDSAAVARRVWTDAVGALRNSDTALAYRHAKRAAAAWPTQPAYVWGSAVMAALTRDTAGARLALAAYADMGLGRQLGTDARFAPLIRAGAWTGLAERLEMNHRPLVNSREAFRLADSTLWPESIDHDPRTRRFYVTSVRHRTVVEVSPDGATREILPRSTPGVGAILAVRVDTARNVLWVTSSGLSAMAGYSPADSGLGAILRVRLADGVVDGRWDVPGAGRHILGDIAVATNGDLYVSNSAQPILFRLQPREGTITAIRSPLFRSLQGVATPRDTRFAVEPVFIADYSHGILRLDPHSGSVTRLPDAPGSTSLGIDGLTVHGTSLIAVQNGVSPPRVMRFHLDRRGERITHAELLDRNSAVADEPTAGVVVDGRFFYVANSQWDKYDDDGRRRPNSRLIPPIILELPLAAP